MVCCIVLNEEPYLLEWVAYNIKLGFSQIYIYDNSKDNSLRDFDWGPCAAHVTIEHFPGPSAQIPAYSHFMEHRAVAHKWVAFIDVDEFIVMRHWRPIDGLLRDLCPSGSVGLNWRFFGDSCNTSYSSEPVLERFTWCSKTIDEEIKCIAHIKDIQTPDIHYANLKNGSQKTAEGVPVPTGWTQPCSKDCLPPVYINHYYCKSIQEFFWKRRRGSAASASNPKRSPLAFFDNNKNDIQDLKAVKFSTDQRLNFQMKPFGNYRQVVPRGPRGVVNWFEIFANAEAEARRELRNIWDLELPSNFDPEMYRILNPDLSSMGDDFAREHYRFFGRRDERQYSAPPLPWDFIPGEYLELNPDIQGQDPCIHYRLHGIEELRPYKAPPLPAGFVAAVYRLLNPDLVHLTDAAAVAHFRLHGNSEGRSWKRAYASALLCANKFNKSTAELPRDFRAAAYRMLHPDISYLDDAKAADHYLQHGRKEGRRYFIRGSRLPRDFSAARYRIVNPDLFHLSDEEAVSHYLTNGRQEARSFGNTRCPLPPDFKPEIYRGLNSDLRASLPTGLESEHYQLNGRLQARPYRISTLSLGRDKEPGHRGERPRSETAIYIICKDHATLEDSRKRYAAYGWARPILPLGQDVTFENVVWAQLMALHDEWSGCDFVGTLSSVAFNKIDLDIIDNFLASREADDAGYAHFLDSGVPVSKSSKAGGHPHFLEIWKYMLKELGLEDTTDNFCNYWICRPRHLPGFVAWYQSKCLQVLMKHPRCMEDARYPGSLTPQELQHLCGVSHYPHVPFILERLHRCYFEALDCEINNS